jgi:hypothetical protein
MSDMLVKLYTLKDDWGFIADQAALGITIRKPLGPEKHLVSEWAGTCFHPYWGGEADKACSNHPISCWIAIRDRALVGFACYDATARGFFGPIGVDESCRGQGTGRALLMACMLDMKLVGYGYAIIGAVGPMEFYARSLDAVEIPDSSPGLFETMLLHRHPSP